MTQIQTVEGPYDLAVTPSDDGNVTFNITGPLFGVGNVTVEAADLLAALGVDARPWVEVESTDDIPDGARMRLELPKGSFADARRFIHPDDVPDPDPDADLIERMAKANHDAQFIAEWGALHESTREAAREGARAALAVIRKEEEK